MDAGAQFSHTFLWTVRRCMAFGEQFHDADGRLCEQLLLLRLLGSGHSLEFSAAAFAGLAISGRAGAAADNRRGVHRGELMTRLHAAARRPGLLDVARGAIPSAAAELAAALLSDEARPSGATRDAARDALAPAALHAAAACDGADVRTASAAAQLLLHASDHRRARWLDYGFGAAAAPPPLLRSIDVFHAAVELGQRLCSAKLARLRQDADVPLPKLAAALDDCAAAATAAMPAVEAAVGGKLPPSAAAGALSFVAGVASLAVLCPAAMLLLWRLCGPGDGSGRPGLLAAAVECGSAADVAAVCGAECMDMVLQPNEAYEGAAAGRLGRIGGSIAPDVQRLLVDAIAQLSLLLVIAQLLDVVCSHSPARRARRRAAAAGGGSSGRPGGGGRPGGNEGAAAAAESAAPSAGLGDRLQARLAAPAALLRAFDGWLAARAMPILETEAEHQVRSWRIGAVPCVRAIGLSGHKPTPVMLAAIVLCWLRTSVRMLLRYLQQCYST